MATFIGQTGAINSFTGTALADRFLWAAANLDSLDRAAGGGGADTLQLTTGGLLASTALQGVNAIERLVLAKAGSGLTLLNANFAGVAGAKIVVRGGDGDDTVDAAGLTGTNRIDVTSGAGLDVLRGGAGRDVFRFTAADLAGDTVSGGGGSDMLVLTSAGAVAPTGLAEVSGVETIFLASGGNQITLTDANFAAPLLSGRLVVRGSAGASTIDAATLTGTHGLSFIDGGGVDTILGGGATDFASYLNGRIFGTDTFDGGGGTDRLTFDRSMDFTGGTISNVEQLIPVAPKRVAVTIGGDSAAGFRSFGRTRLDGLSDTYTIELRAGSRTDLSGLTLRNADAGDAIHVVGAIGNTRVVLSSSIARFTGSWDADTVGFAPGGGYKPGVVIETSAGEDRILFDVGASGFLFDGGDGFDTLVMNHGGTASLTGQSSIRNIESIDASGSDKAVNITGLSGTDDAVLIGSRYADVIASGNSFSTITGGLGADVITGGARGDTFLIYSTAEAQGDTITGGDGYDLLEIRGSTDLSRGTQFSGIERMILAAASADDTFTNASVTVILPPALAATLSEIEGNIRFTDSLETLVVKADSTSLDISNLRFLYWGSEDRVLIEGTRGDDTIRGSMVADLFTGGGGADTFFGLEGDDIFPIDFTLKRIDGGDGRDTILLDTGGLPASTQSITCDLRAGTLTYSTASGDQVQIVKLIEIVDFSKIGAVSTTLIGDEFAEVLIGGAGADTLKGGRAFEKVVDDGVVDTLTGGGGADRFQWDILTYVPDQVTDFTPGEDKLVFPEKVFNVDGMPFDKIAYSLLDRQDADIIVADIGLNEREVTRELRKFEFKYLTDFFLISRDANGHDILYYFRDTRLDFMDSDPPTVAVIADLGTDYKADLNDFLFI
ncbi:MAG: hypothetical protein WCL10_15590 [Novosphingobium sp.]|uniref:hypothetical protein n=1 Tax=Novosphingobium sp. TaxID=1874826 RepID=UPI0030179CA5